MRDLLKRSLTGISLVLLVVLCMLGGSLSFFFLIMLIYFFGTRELFSMNNLYPDLIPVLLGLSGAVMIFIVFAGIRFLISPFWVAVPAFFWIIAFLKASTRNSALLLLFWIVLPLSSYLALGWSSENHTYSALVPLSLVSIIWINDTFAYLSGNLTGKHQMTPKLSPNKTWEGFAGGLLFSMVSGYVIWILTGTFTPGFWLLTAALCSILGLAGDLFESSIKRKRGLKDSGTLLPGHGGILDRFDSLLFASPFLFIILLFENLMK